MRRKYYKGDIILVLNEFTAPHVYGEEYSYMNTGKEHKMYVSSFKPNGIYKCGISSSRLLEYDVWGVSILGEPVGLKKENIILWHRPFINWVKSFFGV